MWRYPQATLRTSCSSVSWQWRPPTRKNEQASKQHKIDLEMQAARENVAKMKDKKIIIKAKAGAGGRLFGSVTAK